MDRNEAKEAARHRLEEYLRRLGWSKGRPCPICGGRGFSVYEGGTKWSCFSEGKTSEDIFALYAYLHGMDPQSAEAMSGVFGELDIEADRFSSTGHKPRTATVSGAKGEEEGEAIERMRFMAAAEGAIEDPPAAEYLSGRGLSLETARRHGLGFAAEWVHPKNRAEGRPVRPSPRLIVPNDGGGYLARAVGRDTPKEFEKQKVAPASTFGVNLIDPADSSPVFIVEGEFDAMSIEEAGGRAAALGSTAHVRRFVQRLNEMRGGGGFSPLLMLALDGDESGARATEALSDELRRGGYRFMRVDVAALYAGAKDANEALVRDRRGLSERISSLLQAEEKANREKLQAKEEAYRDEFSAAGYSSMFSASLEAERPTISTGFPSVDKAISGWREGGLSAGLYVIGAISSLGKTTFILQMADQMARRGTDVLIFSLEMSKAELIGKSVSRRTLANALARDSRLQWAEQNAYTWIDIRDMAKKISLGVMRRDGRRPFDMTDLAAVKQAGEDYLTSTGRRVFIVEGGLDGCTVETVRARIEKHKRMTGKSPVVFIDYLQVLAAPDPARGGTTDKSITDFKIKNLKILSRDFDTPVIAISSFNRESYYKPVSLTSFKESGLIEYSADVVLGLQYCGVADKQDKLADRTEQRVRDFTDKVRARPHRYIEVRILKNRNGGMSDTPRFLFNAPFNYFREVDGEEAEKAVALIDS